MDIAYKAFAFGIGIMTVMSILLLTGHGSFFLVGKTFATEEERDKFDARKFLRFIGICVGAFDLALILAFVSFIKKIEGLAIVSAIIILIVSVGSTIYTRTGQRFNK